MSEENTFYWLGSESGIFYKFNSDITEDCAEGDVDCVWFKYIDSGEEYILLEDLK